MKMNSKANLQERYRRQILANLLIDKIDGEDNIVEALTYNSIEQENDIIEQLYKKYPFIKGNFDIGDYIYWLLNTLEGTKEYLKLTCDFDNFAEIVAYNTVELCELLNDFIKDRKKYKGQV